jgi:hypothetical protein
MTYMISGDILWSAIFPRRPAYLYGAVRVLGSEERRLGKIKVRMLE